MSRALRIGITGLFGSGKSTFSQLLRDRGHVVLDSDRIAKEIMQHDPHARGEIAALLGKQAYDADRLDTQFIASQIFRDRTKQIALESIVHPRVTAAMNLEFATGKQGEIRALESALVLQTELWKEFDYIIRVVADEEAIVKRLKGGRFTEADIRSRLANQTKARIDLDEVDFSIENNGSEEEFVGRCQMMLELLPHLAMRDLPDLPLHQLELDTPESEANGHAPEVN